MARRVVTRLPEETSAGEATARAKRARTAAKTRVFLQAAALRDLFGAPRVSVN